MAVALLFILVIGMMIVGVPIAISLGLSSILFLLWHSDASLASVAQTCLTRLLVTTLYWRSRFLFSPQRLCLLAEWLNGSSVLLLLWLAGSAAV